MDVRAGRITIDQAEAELDRLEQDATASWLNVDGNSIAAQMAGGADASADGGRGAGDDAAVDGSGRLNLAKLTRAVHKTLAPLSDAARMQARADTIRDAITGTCGIDHGHPGITKDEFVAPGGFADTLQQALLPVAVAADLLPERHLLLLETFKQAHTREHVFL